MKNLYDCVVNLSPVVIQESLTKAMKFYIFEYLEDSLEELTEDVRQILDETYKGVQVTSTLIDDKTFTLTAVHNGETVTHTIELNADMVNI